MQTLPIQAAAQAVKTRGSLRLITYFKGKETKAQRGEVTCSESHRLALPDSQSRSPSRTPSPPSPVPLRALISAALSQSYTLPWRSRCFRQLPTLLGQLRETSNPSSPSHFPSFTPDAHQTHQTQFKSNSLWLWWLTIKIIPPPPTSPCGSPASLHM